MEVGKMLNRKRPFVPTAFASRLHWGCREYLVVHPHRFRTQAPGQIAVSFPAIIPDLRSADLLEPVVEVDAGQIVKVFRADLDLRLGDAIDETKRRGPASDSAIVGGPIHGAIEVGESLGPLADHGPNISPAFEREGKSLKALGPVDGMKHAGPAGILAAAALLEQAVDGDQVPHVGLGRVRNLLDADVAQEVDKRFQAGFHGIYPPTQFYKPAGESSSLWGRL